MCNAHDSSVLAAGSATMKMHRGFEWSRAVRELGVSAEYSTAEYEHGHLQLKQDLRCVQRGTLKSLYLRREHAMHFACPGVCAGFDNLKTLKVIFL